MKRISLLSAVASLLLCATNASAQSPVGDAYGGQAALLGQSVGSSQPAPSATGGQPVPSAIGAQAPSANGGQSTPSAGAGEATRVLVVNKGASARENARSAAPVASSSPTLRGASLPFTGFDLVLIAFGGAMLLVLGFGLRRLSRQSHRPA